MALGLGSAPLGIAVPVGVRVGARRLPARWVSSGRDSALRSAAVAGWVAWLAAGAAGRGDKRVVLCGARGSWGAVGAAVNCALTLAGL